MKPKLFILTALLFLSSLPIYGPYHDGSRHNSGRQLLQAAGAAPAAPMQLPPPQHSSSSAAGLQFPLPPPPPPLPPPPQAASSSSANLTPDEEIEFILKPRLTAAEVDKLTYKQQVLRAALVAEKDILREFLEDPFQVDKDDRHQLLERIMTCKSPYPASTTYGTSRDEAVRALLDTTSVDTTIIFANLELPLHHAIRKGLEFETIWQFIGYKTPIDDTDHEGIDAVKVAENTLAALCKEKPPNKEKIENAQCIFSFLETAKSPLSSRPLSRFAVAKAIAGLTAQNVSLQQTNRDLVSASFVKRSHTVANDSPKESSSSQSCPLCCDDLLDSQSCPNCPISICNLCAQKLWNSSCNHGDYGPDSCYICQKKCPFCMTQNKDDDPNDRAKKKRRGNSPSEEARPIWD